MGHAVPLSEEALREFADKTNLLLSRGYRVFVQAVWSERGDQDRYTVTGRVYFKNPKDPNSEIKARWDDDPDIEYSFPFPDISYYDLSFVKVQARMPGGQRVSDPIQSEVGVENPKAFSVIFPLTWKSYIYSEDDFKPRELIRELRDAPQLGCSLQSESACLLSSPNGFMRRAS